MEHNTSFLNATPPTSRIRRLKNAAGDDEIATQYRPLTVRWRRRRSAV